MAKRNEIKPKPALMRLALLEDYQAEQSVSLREVWDIVRCKENPGSQERILVSNLFGTEDEVIRFAQETYGDFLFRTWTIRPSRIKHKAVNVRRILEDLNIEPRALKPDDSQ